MEIQNIIRIYKDTLTQDGSIGSTTRIVYSCLVCHKTCASQYGQLKTYINSGMCNRCSQRTY
jgi:hypothetical protein